MKYFLYAFFLLIATPALAQTVTPQITQSTTAPATPETTPPLSPPDQAVEMQKTTPSLEVPNANGEIALTKDNDVDDADKVGMVVDQMRTNVRACIRTNQGSSDECQCKFPNNLSNLELVYNSTIKLHPDWDGKIVSFKRGTSPTETVSFGGIKNQLTTCAQTTKK